MTTTQHSDFYRIGTVVTGFGTIKAIKSSTIRIGRDYLLVNDEGVTTWLDELAIDEILKPKEIRYE